MESRQQLFDGRLSFKHHPAAVCSDQRRVPELFCISVERRVALEPEHEPLGPAGE